MINKTPARQHFRILIRQSEATLNLAAAAQCIAWEDQGHGEPEIVLRELDALAEGIRPRLADHTSPDAQIDAFNHYLFDELGFKGNTWQYSDPANSFLDHVLTHRSGLPISLSIIYIELGQRLNLPIRGLALPGHFLVQCATAQGDIYIDPFNRGRRWSYAECERQVVAAYGQPSPALIAQIMRPPTKRGILERINRNLKSSYIEMGDLERALGAVERILLLNPHEPQELRDRGLLYARTGLLHLALADLERYAAIEPHAPDLPTLRLQARAIAEQIVLWN